MPYHPDSSTLTFSFSLFLSLCCTGGIYGDAVSGLSGGVLSLTDQNRFVACGEPR